MRCMVNSSGWSCGSSAQVDYPEAPVFYFSWPESVSSLKCLWGAGSEGAKMGAATLWPAFEGLGVCLCARRHLACFGAAVKPSFIAIFWCLAQEKSGALDSRHSSCSWRWQGVGHGFFPEGRHTADLGCLFLLLLPVLSFLIYTCPRLQSFSDFPPVSSRAPRCQVPRAVAASGSPVALSLAPQVSSLPLAFTPCH